MRVLFVSPHADDVCLSALGTVASIRAEKHLVTVFSVSSWAEPHWTEPRDAETITATRMKEDLAFCSAADLRPHALGLEDSSVRHGLEGNLRRSSGDERALTARAADALSALLRERHFSAVFAPLGLGGHADHVVCARAARIAATRNALPVVHYEDLPYAEELSLAGIARASRRLDRDLEAVICHSSLSIHAKLLGADLYASQRKSEIFRAVADHSSRLVASSGRRTAPGEVAERLWVRGGESVLRETVEPALVLSAPRGRGVAGWLERRQVAGASRV